MFFLSLQLLCLLIVYEELINEVVRLKSVILQSCTSGQILIVSKQMTEAYRPR